MENGMLKKSFGSVGGDGSTARVGARMPAADSDYGRPCPEPNDIDQPRLALRPRVHRRSRRGTP